MKQIEKKVVVTGGAGFIGSNLVDRLLSEGYEVHIIDNLVGGKKENVNPNAVFHNVDICDLEKIKPIIKDSEYVFHLAALPRVQYSIDFPKESSEVNIGGTINVLIASKEGGVKKVIYSASSAAYGDQEIMPLSEDMPTSPKSPYGAQKYIGEILCKQWSDVYGLSTVSLRYFNVYGPRLDPTGAYALVIGIFIRLKKEGKALTITGDGTQTRDFTHVRDVVNANFLSAITQNVGNGEVINIGSGKNYSINKLAEMFNSDVEYLPARLEPHDTLADNSRARKLLAWEPKVSLEEGIEELLKEWKLK